MKRIKLLLADDHNLVRSGMRLLLESQPDFEVIGEADNGREAVRRFVEDKPDMVIMDIAMPELNGIEAVRQIRESDPAARIIILSMHISQNYMSRALQAGARGYILKSSVASELITAVKTVWAGQRYLSQKISDQMVNTFLNFDLPQEETPLARLSAREKEILKLVVDGNTSADIASFLSISPNTVDTYRSRIMNKLGLKNIPSLVKFAIQEGITSLD
ncbi:MAG: response regulator transcription factor [Anaerolineae bacterium]|nr:response regulator transcription factor [Anaerolineae bacterium]